MTAPVLMMMRTPTVADPADGGPAFVPADPTAPQIRVDDLGVTRGDGVFETVNAVEGHLQALDAHLERLRRSAAMLELPDPAVEHWAAAVRAAVDAHEPAAELLVKLVLTRGPELGTGTALGRPGPGSGCTGWVLATKAPDFSRARAQGIDVITLARCLPSDVQTLAPWLLAGSKSLSYALNMATLRWAHDHGADDAVFVSTDGLLLEGPNSTFVVQRGDTLTTPPVDLGILHGTAQARMFGFAEKRGLRTEYGPLRVEDLHTADTVWNCSSGKLAAPVRSVDGVARTWDAVLHEALLADLLGDRS